jgi:hypothetical protein
MTNRDDLRRMIREASGGQKIAQAVAALDAFDRNRTAMAGADRETDLGARIAAERLTPFPVHEHHTAATDWLADYEAPPSDDYRTAMIAEASTWYRSLDRAVRADPEELAAQASGRARTLASAYASRAAAEGEFLSVVGYLHAQAASGLPQIDQTVDPNNQPSATPYPTEVFPTFGEEQDPYNAQVEGLNHDSQVSSQQAPLIQQVMQQQNGGSGFGSGPERPDSHTTQFDTADSYAEVPLGPPGMIPTAPVATDSMASSAPNPVAGVPQDEGSDRRTAAVIDGYSLPDPYGYRWAMQPEVMHPFHERCGSAHWPDESCGDRSHTASVAVGYLMNIDSARHVAACEAVGVKEGLRAVTSSHSLAELGTAHNRVAAAWGATDRTMDDTAVLRGFMAVVRPVLAEAGRRASMSCTACKGGDCGNCQDRDCGCAKHPKGVGNRNAAAGRTSEPHGKVVRYVNEMAKEYGTAPAGGGKTAARGRLDFKAGSSDPDNDGDDDSTAAGDTDHDYFSTDGRAIRPQAASGLPQLQQVTDPNNQPAPQDDELPEGVAFPLGDNSPSSTFRQQWSTGPDGPQPRTGAKAELPPGDAEALGRAAASRGDHPQHKGSFPHNPIQHGRYLGAWNETAGLMHGAVGRAAMSRDEYEKHTGRGDLHPQYLAAYAQGRKMNVNSSELYRADDGGQVTASRKTADTWSPPHQTTDDLNPPYNTPQTSPDPWSQNEGGGDFQAGVSAGQSDNAAGEHPLFADNSSGVSPYVKGYAQGYGQGQAPAGQQDVPRSMGGDSGQAANAQEAQRSFQVARASLRRVSAAFAPQSLMADPEFSKAYKYAFVWEPGVPLVTRGTARFEAGLYAGITDQPAKQQAWLAEHARFASSHPELGRRVALHESFTRKAGAGRGVYVRQAGTSTDLITDGPGTSPDPMGATPLNGPGSPPPMGGLSNPAAPGGAPPYQGTAPLPGGPVVPDDVMGRAQQQPQPDGPTVQTFSGMHPENAQLAPVAPNKADQSGYTNAQAYQGDPRGGQRLAAFRSRVQANLRRVTSESYGPDEPYDDSYAQDYPSKGYDTEYAPSPGQLEDDEIRRQVNEEAEHRRGPRQDNVIVTRNGRGY